MSDFEGLPQEGQSTSKPVERVAGIIKSHIGYDEVRETPALRPGSHLNLTNRAEGRPYKPVSNRLGGVGRLATRKT